MSSERPIIFSGESVCKILCGDKTQTRRIIKPSRAHLPNGARFFDVNGNPPAHAICHAGESGWVAWFGHARYPREHYEALSMTYGKGHLCPYGETGDRLWVRETWADEASATGCPDDAGNTLYRATDPGWDDADSGLKWKSPIYMPRVRSRLTLEITKIRVERLNEITAADLKAEGFSDSSRGYAGNDFQNAWNKLNGKTFPWESNPFVWVIEFSIV